MTIIALKPHHTAAYQIEKERHLLLKKQQFIPFYPLFCPLAILEDNIPDKECLFILQNFSKTIQKDIPQIFLGSPILFQDKYILRPLVGNQNGEPVSTFFEKFNSAIKENPKIKQIFPNWPDLIGDGFSRKIADLSINDQMQFPPAMMYGFLLNTAKTKGNGKIQNSTIRLNKDNNKEPDFNGIQPLKINVFQIACYEIQSMQNIKIGLNWTEKNAVWVKLKGNP